MGDVYLFLLLHIGRHGSTRCKIWTDGNSIGIETNPSSFVQCVYGEESVSARIEGGGLWRCAAYFPRQHRGTEAAG